MVDIIYPEDSVSLSNFIEFLNAVIKGRVARQIENLDNTTLRAIAISAVPAEFADLDKVIEGWKPETALEKIQTL
jgi:replicative DNA helicase